jgi:REP element-mobilizing transposase RayT
MPASKQTRHKNIRLDARNYMGTGWYFLTLCTAGRTPYFRSESLARWVLRVLHAEAAREFFRVRAYCGMPDHLHLLLHGTSPEANMLHFVKAFKHRTSFRFAGKLPFTTTSCAIGKHQPMLPGTFGSIPCAPNSPRTSPSTLTAALSLRRH